MKRESRASDLDRYCAEIRRYPLLTAEEERRLARVTGHARTASRHRLVTGNLRFVVKIAHEYRWSRLPLVDMVQEGNVGLLKAVQRFDPDRNVRLVTYAAPWIRAHILDHVMRTFSLVRLGTTSAQRRLFSSLARARRELAVAGEADDPSHAMLARKLQLKVGDVEDMSVRMGARDLSLDCGPVDDGSSFLDLLVDDGPAQDDALAAAQEREQVRASVRDALDRLDRRERFIVEQRAMSDAPLTLEDLGGRLSISSERARQIELRAARKLKRDLDAVGADQLAVA